ncbi:hypothetical protein [Methylobacterium sp. CCH5-D2]|uniref:hypothetical protein n=1 Tax=Methylobacterium sp. CCH5-D2 TaxID=1768765 RepID=UPI000A4E25ED|nr:hypothetical protein [Methylobacterium sp. CCH5-D2]
MDEAWKQARLGELWEAVLKLFRDPDHAIGKGKDEIACELLRNYKKWSEIAESIGRSDEALVDDDPLRRSATGYLIWQLLSLDAATWTLSEVVGSPENGWSGIPARMKLQAYLNMQVAAQWPSHGRAIDPMPLFIPRELVIELIEAMDALDRGEVLPILEPVPNGRHDTSWQWDVMRTRALQYVEFLRGQGQTKKNALSLVAIATGVSVHTLRDWETTIEPTEPIEPAFEAGKIKFRQGIDPTYGSVGGEAADATGLYYLKNQMAAPLSEFGRLYQERFGRRHNQSPSDGK